MNGMFDLGMPWWQFALRAAIVYVVVLGLIRLSGKHTLGELSVFDLLVVIVVGSSLRTSMIGNDKSLPGGLLVVGTLLLMDFVFAWAASHSRRLDRVLQGRPILLASKGEVFWDMLKRCRISRSTFESVLRKHGCTSPAAVDLAILEPGGTVTIQKREPGSKEPI